MVTNSIDIAAYLGIPQWLLVLVVIWSLAWMGIAMWLAAKKNHLAWFVVFLLFHTLGILEILYIFVFSKMSARRAVPVQAARKKRR